MPAPIGAVAGSIVRSARTRQKSAEAVVPVGSVNREGPNIRRADLWSGSGGHLDRSHLANASQPDEEAVNPAEPPAERSDLAVPTASEAQPAGDGELWGEIFSRPNLFAALRRVERNHGAPGVDQMTVDGLRPWLKDHWPEVRRQLDEGTYRPAPVRRVTIPKPDGGERELGVPTALDRVIQQAIAQVLVPIFDPQFSSQSFGFRPGRSAHQAVRAARDFVAEGYHWAVDVDLERFFDQVQHDVLMARVARRVSDKRVLRTIRRYLEAGTMVDGVKQASAEGTPQGSPLSPLLSNIMLDDLDRELERRGHRFVRYADDVRVYVKSQRAGERVLAGITEFLQQRLKLPVNPKKSSVQPASTATILGFGFYFPRGGGVGIRVGDKPVARMRQKVRRLSRRRWRVTMAVRVEALNRFIRGWCGYFSLADSSTTFIAADKWLRRRLRQVRWVEWKVPKARRHNLRKLGMPEADVRRWAGTSKGSWRIAGTLLHRALPNAYWDAQGLSGFWVCRHRLRSA